MAFPETDFQPSTDEQSAAWRFKVSWILGELALLVPYLPYGSVKKEDTATVINCGKSGSIDGITPRRITIEESASLITYRLFAVVVTPSDSGPKGDFVEVDLVTDRGKWIPDRSLIVTTPCDAACGPDETRSTSKVDPVAAAQFFEKGLWELRRLIC